MYIARVLALLGPPVLLSEETISTIHIGHNINYLHTEPPATLLSIWPQTHDLRGSLAAELATRSICFANMEEPMKKGTPDASSTLRLKPLIRFVHPMGVEERMKGIAGHHWFLSTLLPLGADGRNK